MKAKRFVFCSDTHGDELNEKVANTFHAFCKDFKPEVRIHGGDIWDFRCLRKGASEDDLSQGVVDDIEMGNEFLHRLKPTHVLYGNHDRRVFLLAKHGSGFAGDFARSLVGDIDKMMVKFGAQTRPYDKREGHFKFGHLTVLHGFHGGLTAAKRAAEVFGNVIQGHTHTIDHAPIARIERTMGRCAGCLCNTDQEYNAAQANTLKQANGWIYGLLLDNGLFKCEQAEEIDGRWILPMQFKEMGA